MIDIPQRGWHSELQSSIEQKKKNLSPSRSRKKTYSYSVSSSTITCLSIANQSRPVNPNRQSSEVASKNTNLALSQLQPIREGTYVAELHRAPRGYANVQDLPHDLPSFSFPFFLSCKPCWRNKPPMKEHGDIAAQFLFCEEVIKRSPNNRGTLTLPMPNSITLFR